MSRTTSSDRPRRAFDAGRVRVVPAEVVPTQTLDAGLDVGVRGLAHVLVLSDGAGRVLLRTAVLGTAVVHTCAPLADRGEPLDVPAEQPRERLGLGLAQLRELGGHVGHRAVVLAELVAGRRRLEGGGVPVRAQRVGEGLDALVGRCGVDADGVAVLDVARDHAGEVRHGGRTRDPGQLVQGLGGEPVVRLRERLAALDGERVDLGRTPAPALAGGAVRRPVARLDLAGGGQRVQVAPDGGGGEPEPLGQDGRGGRTVGQEAARDARTGAVPDLLAGLHDFHNAIVCIFVSPIQQGSPNLRRPRPPWPVWTFTGPQTEQFSPHRATRSRTGS